MDNFKDTIQNVTKSVYKTSKGFIKTTKLSLDLANEESGLKAIYLEVGKKVHEIYAYGGSLGKFFDEKYKEILEREQKIDSIRRGLDEAKGTRTCPKCGRSAASSAEFCPKCGTRMDETLENASFSQNAYAPPYNQPPAPYPSAPPPYPSGQTYGPDPSYPSDGGQPYTAEPAAEPIPASSSKRCPVCGKENAAENKFCFSCGRSI